MVHQEGHMLGTLAWGWGSSSCVLPAGDNCNSLALPNILTCEGFPLGKPRGSTAGPCAYCSLGGVSPALRKVIFPPPASTGDLDQPTTQIPGHFVSPHVGILERICFAMCCFYQVSMVLQAKVGWVLQHTKQILLFLLKQSCLNCVWDAREFKRNYLKLLSFLKKHQNKKAQTLTVWQWRVTLLFSTRLNGRENIRKHFHFAAPKRLFPTIPRKNISEVPKIRGVLHLLIFMVSHWSCWYLTLALKS